MLLSSVYFSISCLITPTSCSCQFLSPVPVYLSLLVFLFLSDQVVSLFPANFPVPIPVLFCSVYVLALSI
ncbi:putative signal peptide protein [Puccinia sorghi]|uniref:Putative signal peptide protein n=1 Tax=Puccinia sorghi TaxID=27349 RepID=A0A0L6UI98_9BASI|nr:putative signal peptide protein [Puccinia sorghi]